MKNQNDSPADTKNNKQQKKTSQELLEEALMGLKEKRYVVNRRKDKQGFCVYDG